MNERFAFWKGVTAGIFGGIAIGVLIRLSAAEAERLRSNSGAPGSGEIIRGPGNRYGASSSKLRLRRDGAESAGDPRMTGPATTPDSISGRAFERPPGAPGGQTPAEILEAPGRPGQPMDHATHAHETEEALPVL